MQRYRRIYKPVLDKVGSASVVSFSFFSLSFSVCFFPLRPGDLSLFFSSVGFYFRARVPRVISCPVSGIRSAVALLRNEYIMQIIVYVALFASRKCR